MMAMTKSQKQLSHVLIGVGYLYPFANRPYDGNGLGINEQLASEYLVSIFHFTTF